MLKFSHITSKTPSLSFPSFFSLTKVQRFLCAAPVMRPLLQSKQVNKAKGPSTYAEMFLKKLSLQTTLKNINLPLLTFLPTKPHIKLASRVCDF